MVSLPNHSDVLEFALRQAQGERGMLNYYQLLNEYKV
jgi:hypothetical protein